MDEPGESPPSAPKSAHWWQFAQNWHLPKLPLLIGVIGLGAAVSTGVVVKHRADARQLAEVRAIRAELTDLRSDAADYELRLRSLHETSARLHALADRAADEPERVWAAERARRFDDLVARLEQNDARRQFAALAAQVERDCASGEVAAARDALLQLPPVAFPGPDRFEAMRAQTYLAPLAQFSRQNPDYYRAFKKYEPEAARADMAALRTELTVAPVDTVTPQAMMRFELFAAVAPPDDPLVADWATLSTAPDYFENPTPAAIGAWLRARRAMRAQDWGHAAAEMQSILRLTVRTRQPFRAAYARAILRSNPDDPAAYPFIVEAAASGDAAARAWVAQDAIAKGRYAEALRWLEAGVAAGDPTAADPLVKLYAMDPQAVPRDPARELGALRKIVTTPDAPALAWMLLARLYESGVGGTAAPAAARAAYRRAADKAYAPAAVELARCALRGIGGPADPDEACAEAVRAYQAGERSAVLPVLTELMRDSPEHAAKAVQVMLEHETVADPAGFADTRRQMGGVSQLQTLLARYLDRQGRYGEAAHFYKASGSRDPAIVNRRDELTAQRVCETCGGTGKVTTYTPCPVCGGKGTVTCPVCEGRGYSWVPGTPPCPTCGGTGTLVQDGKIVACPACGGTGKGKGSTIKQPCPNCNNGRVPCRACGGTGFIKTVKECPDCHGSGHRSLADG